jgi:diguanylate cyclase (GGDEF)-like protein
MTPKARLFRRSHPLLELAGILSLMFLVGAMDLLTGHEFKFTDFYLLPLVWTAWRMGRGHSWLVAGIASAVEVTVDMLDGRLYAALWLFAWDFFAEYLILGAVGELLVRLRESLERERSLARTDALTGLANRRFFTETLAVEMDRAFRYRHPFTLAMIDLDHFKEVNDALGHKTGDRVLRAAAEVLREQVRTTDVPARLGGDEFAVLFPETDEKGARQMLPELHRRLSGAMKAANWPVTFSIGAVTFHKPPKALEQVLAEADKRMYHVKNAGRNGVAYGRH